MRYDSNKPIALAKDLDSFGDSVKSLRIQCAEALVDKEAVKADGANRLKKDISWVSSTPSPTTPP